LTDLLDLETRELVQADLEDRVRLHLVELERVHQALRGIGARLGFAYDADRAVEVVVDLRERVEDVKARLQLALLVLEPPRYDDHAEVEELAAEVAERDARRLPDALVRRGEKAREVH